MFGRKHLLVLVIGILILTGSILSYEIYETNLAHTTFDRYYAFRGCVQLLDKTATYGDCEIADGQTIRIILYKGKWYLEGDLPIHSGNFTF